MIIQKYLIKRVFISSISITLILVGMVWLMQSLRFIEIIINHNISFVEYFTLVACLIPDTLGAILPIGFLLGGTYTFSRLLQDHELVVFGALGLSQWDLYKPIGFLSVSLAMVVLLINLFISPKAFQIFREHEHFIRNQFSDAAIRPSTFNSFKGTTIYFDMRDKTGALKNILIHQLNDDLDTTIIAKRGEIRRDQEKIYLYLQNGQRQEKNLGTQKHSVIKFSEFFYNLSSYLKDVEKRTIKPYEMPLGELLFPDSRIDYKLQTKMKIEGHQKVLTPLLLILDGLIVCLFLAGVRTTRRKLKRPYIILLVCALGLHVSVISLLNMSARSSHYIIFSYILMGMIFVFCFHQLIKRSSRYALLS